MNAALFTTMALLSLASAQGEDAPAGGAEEQARALFEAGGVAYGRARYADAVHAFEEAYALVPKPAVAFSLAQALRRRYLEVRDPRTLRRAITLYTRYLREVSSGGRREDATDHLQALLAMRAEQRAQRATGPAPKTPDPPPAEPPDPPPPPPRTELMIYTRTPSARLELDGTALDEAGAVIEVTPGAHELRAEADGYFPERREVRAVEGRLLPIEIVLEPRPAALALETEDDARVTIDGARTVQTPLSAPLSLDAGTHALVIEKPGHRPWSGPITLALGESRTLEVPLELTAQREAAHWTMGSGAGLALAGATTTVLALYFQGRAQSVTDARGQRNVEAGELAGLDADVGRRDALRTTSVVLYSTAIVAVATGLYLYFTDAPRAE